MRLHAFSALLTTLLLAACGGGGETGDAGPDGGDGGLPDVPCKCVDAPPPGPSTLTVLNAAGTSLVSFAADASGDTAPTATISGNQTNLSSAVAVAADPQGNLYVAVPLAILVFPPGASGNVAPARTIAGPAALPGTDDFVGVAVGSDGTIYAASEATSGTSRNPKILVFPPNANGNVSPTRTITGSTTTMQAVLGVGLVGSQVAEADASQNVLFFDQSGSGNVAPQRTLKTPQGIAEGMAFDQAGDLFLALYEFTTSTVAKWASGAQNADPPVANITGPTTKITTVGGVAIGPDGSIYVANADPAGSSVLVFAPTAVGDAAPLRSISGASTTLSGDASQYPMPLVVY